MNEETEGAGALDYGTAERRKGMDLFARIYSIVCHPFFLPTIGVTLLLFGNTFVSLLPRSLKYYLIGVVMTDTMAVPAAVILILRRTGLVSDFSLASRRERSLSMVAVAVGYVLCAVMLSRYMMIGIMHGVLYGALIALLVCFIVNFRWKISLHMTAMGGIVGLLLSVNLLGYGRMPVALMVFILLAGLLGTVRLYLGRHDLWQVIAGFLTGFLSMYICMRLF